MKTSIKILLCCCFLAAALVGCANTAQGVGQDMQENGQAIEDSTK